MGLHVLFLGYGKMGSALGQAWLGAGAVQSIDAVDPSARTPSHADSADASRLRIFSSAAQLPAQAYDLVVMAVKPALLRQALADVPPPALQRATLISIMAGVGVAALEAALPCPRPVVRCMPNTAVVVGQGYTVLHGNPAVDAAQRAQLLELFAQVGQACWVEDEELLHAVTAISGSGPAYFHLFSEALAEAGVSLGLPPALARDLAAQTALGAGSLQCQGGGDFVALREAVTSPNGTTAAALAVFEQDGALRQLVRAAAQQAHARSIALAQG